MQCRAPFSVCMPFVASFQTLLLHPKIVFGTWTLLQNRDAEVFTVSLKMLFGSHVQDPTAAHSGWLA